jgi:hypothetical protein
MKRAIRPSIISLWLACVATGAWGQEPDVRLVIDRARDAERGFVAREQESLGRRILAWPEGVVSTPDSLDWLADADDGLAFALIGDRISATGVAGALPLAAGSYTIDTPILLTDGRLVAFFAAGRLEVGDGVVRYRAPAPPLARGGTLYILAGVALATAVLLRALHRRPRRS